MRLTYSAVIFLLGCLFSLTSSADAADIEGRLLGATFRGRVTRGVSPKTRVLLSGGRFMSHVGRDGYFSFPDVPTGIYMLEVQSPHLVYTKIRLQVAGDLVVATRVSIGDHFSGYPQPLALPLVLKPRPRPMHYIPPEGAKVAGWFGHPMILMSGFSCLMLLLMPKIMANLDESALEALRSSYDFGSLPTLPQHQPFTTTINMPQHQPVSEPYVVSEGKLDPFAPGQFQNDHNQDMSGPPPPQFYQQPSKPFFQQQPSLYPQQPYYQQQRTKQH